MTVAQDIDWPQLLAERLTTTHPDLLRDLHSQRVPHLPVRVRDGLGLVGPLVIPGMFPATLVRGLNSV
jgi:hypothetical protein